MVTSSLVAKKNAAKAVTRREKTEMNASDIAASTALVTPTMTDNATTAPANFVKNKKKDKLANRTVPRKQKMVRDSFTMPEHEYQALVDIKKTLIKAGVEVKKSQLLRIAIAQMVKMDVAQITEAMGVLAPVKAGRPSKDSK